MTALWTFLLCFRWPFIASVALFGIAYGNTMGNDLIRDPEIVLPRIISELLPIGIRGIVVSGS